MADNREKIDRKLFVLEAFELAFVVLKMYFTVIYVAKKDSATHSLEISVTGLVFKIMITLMIKGEITTSYCKKIARKRVEIFYIEIQKS